MICDQVSVFAMEVPSQVNELSCNFLFQEIVASDCSVFILDMMNLMGGVSGSGRPDMEQQMQPMQT